MRSSYPGSLFQPTDPVSSLGPLAYQRPASRVGSTIARFLYRLLVTVLVIAALAGVVFGLYRNDLLLTAARQVGLESQYLTLEARIGSPGWGTPRSVGLPADATSNSDLAPSGDLPAPAAEAAPLAAAPEPETPAAPEPEATPPAAAAEPAKATADGLPIVSLDALPTLPKEGEKALAPVSIDSLPPSVKAPAAVRAPTPVARAAPPATPKPAPAAKPAAAEKPAAPKKPEPVAKSEAPKPEPAPAPAPRRKDNPLTAAIRAAVDKQGSD